MQKKKFSLSQGISLQQVLEQQKGPIHRIAWSPDGEMIASPSDGTVHLWDFKHGKLLRSIKVPLNKSSVRRALLAEAGKVEFSGENSVWSVAWSPSSLLLALSAEDRSVQVWRVKTGELLWSTKLDEGAGGELAWSPDGGLIAVACSDNVVRIFDARMGKLRYQLTLHSNSVPTVAWSADGKTLATGSFDKKIFLWDSNGWKIRQKLEGHSNKIWSVAWSPNGNLLASASEDKTIRLWDTASGKQIIVLEGHTKPVKSLAYSSEGSYLASRGDDGIRLWRSRDNEQVIKIDSQGSQPLFLGISFHPKEPILASPESSAINIWDVDYTKLDEIIPSHKPARYSNAKVVLVGDTGVGKSGLAFVLTGQPWEKTESTHGRRVWVFENRDVARKGGVKETRETLLWDLAGQPDYRLIHQLHLTEVAVVLVVFDSRSQTDPFSGVKYWDRALRQAQRVQGQTVTRVKKFLVAARADVGRIGVSTSRIEALKNELDFDGYFETSAKEGWGVIELSKAIRKSINWRILPAVSSNELFQNIKEFLVLEKTSGRLLSSIDDLYRAYLKYDEAVSEIDELRAQFETCIGRVESSGLIRKLSFANLILLQPELQDVYASAIANAVKDEPDGLGSIKEDKARVGDFRIAESERINDKAQEKLLLISTVEELLRHEIALREQGDDGQYLVFPSQLTRENPDLPDPEGKAVTFSFEGPVLNIYATLAVRLSYSGIFSKKDMWKNAATYAATTGGTCGMFLREIEEGRGELTLFFDVYASEETRYQFEEYIRIHLQRRALPNTVQRRRIFICHECETPISDLAVRRRREKNYEWIACNVCEPPTRISILDREERLTLGQLSKVPEMDRAANAQLKLEMATSTIQGKVATSDFDVFLCHNSKDKSQVKIIGELLKKRGILPWLDEWELRPGLPWQRLLEQQIANIKSAAVFVGIDGIGPWQRQELDAFLREFVERGCPVIPVVLENAPKKPVLPIFLKGMTWVDFRKKNPEPLERLIWGITGERDEN